MIAELLLFAFEREPETTAVHRAKLLAEEEKVETHRTSRLCMVSGTEASM
jgi:hypothetical protein